MGRSDVAEVTIRPAVLDDQEAIARLWAGLVAYHHQRDAALPAAAYQGPKRYARRVVQRLDDPHHCVLVAELDERVVGFVLGMVVDLLADIFDQKPIGFLADIYVDETCRRRGIGRALVAALAAWFRERGLRSFEWQVAACNPEGLAFWRAMGGRDVMVRMRAELEDGES